MLQHVLYLLCSDRKLQTKVIRTLCQYVIQVKGNFSNKKIYFVANCIRSIYHFNYLYLFGWVNNNRHGMYFTSYFYKSCKLLWGQICKLPNKHRLCSVSTPLLLCSSVIEKCFPFPDILPLQQICSEYRFYTFEGDVCYLGPIHWVPK